MNAELKFPFYAKASLVFVGILSAVAMLFLAQGIILPVVYSTIIAIVLSPLVNLFARKGMNRVVAIATTLILLLFVTLLIAALLSVQVMQFSDSLPNLVAKFHQLLDQTVTWTSAQLNISTFKIDVWIGEKSTQLLKEMSSAIGQTLISTGNMVIALVLIPVYTFMILHYQPLLLEFVHKLFKSSRQTEVSEVLSATKRIIQSYLVGLLLEALIIAVLNSTSLMILGIDYAILLGVTGAILNVVPYIGGIIAVALPMVIALSTKSPTYALLVLVCYIIIQFIDNHFIIPRIVASKVKINALASVVVVIVGGVLWGIPGMFLSIPLTAILKVIFDHVEGLKPWGYLLGNVVNAPPVTESGSCR